MDARRKNFADKVGVLLLICVLALLFWRIVRPPTDVPPVARGTPMPPLEVAGWLNVPAGEAFEPTGKIVVVDCWATWCVPCRMSMPRLAEVAAQYRPLGVDFVGLTDETEESVEGIESFIDETPGFNWPVGYGAAPFMRQLNIRVIPTVIVFGPDRKARWSGVGGQGLEAALDEALAATSQQESEEPKAAN